MWDREWTEHWNVTELFGVAEHLATIQKDRSECSRKRLDEKNF
jgi:hypothetical protein